MMTSISRNKNEWRKRSCLFIVVLKSTKRSLNMDYFMVDCVSDRGMW